MLLKFTKPFNGSDDGLTLKRFKAEGTYTVPSDLSYELATIAIENGYAVQASEGVETQTLEAKAEENVEVIDIEEEEKVEEKKEQKRDKYGFKKFRK